jgi:hypothetical protein
MADSQTNININIDTSQALANLKALQSQISAFQTSMASGSATQAANAAKLRQNLVNDINATKKFSASIQTIQTTTESFTESLEKNKLSMGQYFRYAGASTKTFGKLFKTEFSTIEKVARERVKTLQTQYIQLGRDANGAMKAIAVRPLVLDMENLGTKTAIAAQKQQILNQLLKQGSTNLLNFGKNTQWAGRQLMVGFTIPLTMAGTAAAKAFMEMEQAVIKFRRVYGDLQTTATETDKMARDLQKLASEYTKYGVAVSKTMDMAAQAAATGKTGAELLAQVANATRLSVLGNVEQAQALETTISLTNAFGTAAKDLAGEIDFLNSVENQTVTSIEDLTIAIPKAAPVIKQLGGDVKDLAFFLTAMKEGGINASEGANALKSGIASIINPTAKASEFLAGFGINLKGIVESNTGNVKGMIVGVAQALDTLDPLNRARAIEQMFGKFQFARISTLFQNVTKEGTQASRVLELATRTTQELAILSQRELKQVESSPMFKFQKAIEDFKKELIPVGGAFLKAITPIVKFAGEAVANFNKMGEGAKSFWMGLTLVVAGIGPVLLMTVGLIANGVANLIKMFTGIKNVFNKTSGDTTVLGEATEYMTQKQLEAAAVAASLEQVHQTLEQRFTSEAGALDKLTTAYQNNVAAQSQYSNANVIPTNIDVDGYASGGIIRGPGSGTSDSILAMVSNGEAIIPAKAVARNPQLVSALISGNIPGFSKGGVAGFEMAHTASELPQTASVLAEMDKVFAGFSTISERLRSVIQILPDATVWKSETLNQRAKGAGLTKSEFEMEWQKDAGHSLGGFGPLADRARAAGQLDSGSEIDAAVKNLDVELGKRVAEKIDNGNIDKSVTGWLDDLIEQTTNQIIEEFSTKGSESQQKVASAYRARAATPATIRTTAIQDLTDPATGMPYEGAEQAILDMVSRGELEARQNRNGRTDYYAPGTDFKFGRTNSRGKARSNSVSPGSMRGMVLGGAYETGPISIDKLKTDNPIAPAKLGAEDMASYAKGAKSAVTPKDDPFKTIEDNSKRNSPHQDASTLGAEDAQAYKSAFGNISNDPLAAAKQASATPLIDVASAQQKLTKKSLNIVSEAIANQSDPLAGIKGKVMVVSDGLNDMATAVDDATAAANEQANATQDQTTATTDNTTATDKNTDAKEENTNTDKTSTQDENRANRNRAKSGFQRSFGTVAKIGAAATTIVGMASMIPGKVGEVAQSITPSIGAFTTLTAMVNGPVTGALAALIAVVGGIVMAITNLDKAYNETQEKVLSLKKVVGTSAESIRGLSEFAGRVSAGELMDQMRKDRMKLVYAAPGKTTFGESYVDSDQGKALVSSMKEDMARKGGNTSGTVASITGQLSTAVMSGALSEAEAFSIASNIGAELGNMDITMQVRAQLSEILGPNGEKVDGNGVLTVASGLQERNIATMSESMQVLSSNMEANRLWSGGENTALNRNVTAGGTVLASAGAGAGIGAGIGFGVGTALAAFTAGISIPVFTAIGATIGTIAGAITGYNVAMGTLEEQTKAVAELGAVVAADMVSTLSTQKEMADSLDAYYLKKIEEARIEGDITEAKRLQAEYDEKRNQMAEVGLQAREAIMQLYSTTDAAELEAVDKGLQNALSVRYKDDAIQQMYLPIVEQQLGSAVENDVATQPQTALIRAELAAGTLTPQDASNLLKIMATDKEAGKKLFSIETKFGATTMGEVAQVAAMFSGDNAKEQRANFVMAVDAAATSSEAQDVIDFTREIAKYAGVMKNTVLVDVIQKNPAATEKLQGIFDQLDNNKGKMTAEVAYNIVPSLKGSEAFDEKYFNSLKDANEKITYVKTISAILEMSEPDLKASPDFIRWQGDEGKKLGAYPGNHSVAWWQRQYAEDMGVKVTNALATDTTVAPGKETPTGGGGGPEASWLDPIVARVRNLYDSAQKLTIGYKASGDALKAFAKTGKSALTGLSGMGDKLYKANLSQDIIDGILGMPKEEAEKWMKMFFDKNGKITDFVKNLNATIGGLNYEQYMQENVALNNTLKNQQTATIALTKFNSNLSVSRSILNDENATAILAGAMLSGTLEQQKKKTEDLTKAYLDNMAADRLRKDSREVSIEDANIQIDTLQKENDIYQNGVDIIGKKAEKVAEVYDRQIEALNKVKSVNEEINKQKQSELDVADALSRGDIGAAAKAIQQMRAQQAQDAADRQVKALEDAKKRAIDSVTVDINGQTFTRAELESKIYDIEIDVLEIKKDQILQNELSLAQGREELNNIIKQIAKLKELKAVKELPVNKPGKDGSSSGGSSTSSTTDGKKDDPAIIDPANQTTVSTGSGASAFDASNALKGTTAAGVAAMFGGQRTFDASLSNVSMSKATANQAEGAQALKDIMLEAWQAGVANYDGKTGLHVFKSRKDIPAASRKDFDDLLTRYNKQVAENQKIQTADDNERNNFIKSLPQQVQNALNVLKNRVAERTPLANKEMAAKKAWTETIKRELGFDANNRPIVVTAQDRTIADAAMKKYLDDGGRNLSLFDSRIAQLERSLSTAGFSKGKITSLIGKYAAGGYVSGNGTATSDSIPAMLSNGEYVVRANAVKTLGTEFLDRLNSADKVSFADGGLANSKNKSVPKEYEILKYQEAIKAAAEARAAKNNPFMFLSNLTGQSDKKLQTNAQKIKDFTSKYGSRGLNGIPYSKQLSQFQDSNAAFANYQLGVLANDKSINMEAARVIASFTPGIGSGVGLAGTAQGVASGDLKSAGVSALGAFGGFGGALKLGSKALNATPGLARTTALASKADSGFGKFNNKFGTYANVAGTSQGYVESWLTQNKMLPKFHMGGMVPGSYEMPIMAKGGEFVMSDYAVKQYGTGTMNAMNSGNAAPLGDSVYNYSVNVNVANTGANPNDIARTVISQIKQIDAQRIRSNNL